LLKLDAPEATLAKLTVFLSAAYTAFAAGKALPGPGAAEDHNDLAFALPGGAKESYVDLMRLWLLRSSPTSLHCGRSPDMGAIAPALPDSAARLTALIDHDHSLLVEAGAGSARPRSWPAAWRCC